MTGNVDLNTLSRGGLALGDVVEVHSLRVDGSFNGQRGTVVGRQFVQGDEQLLVALPSLPTPRALLPRNLARITEGPPDTAAATARIAENGDLLVPLRGGGQGMGMLLLGMVVQSLRPGSDIERICGERVVGMRLVGVGAADVSTTEQAQTAWAEVGRGESVTLRFSPGGSSGRGGAAAPAPCTSAGTAMPGTPGPDTPLTRQSTPALLSNFCFPATAPAVEPQATLSSSPRTGSTAQPAPAALAAEPVATTATAQPAAHTAQPAGPIQQPAAAPAPMLFQPTPTHSRVEAPLRQADAVPAAVSPRAAATPSRPSQRSPKAAFGEQWTDALRAEVVALRSEVAALRTEVTELRSRDEHREDQLSSLMRLVQQLQQQQQQQQQRGLPSFVAAADPGPAPGDGPQLNGPLLLAPPSRALSLPPAAQAQAQAQPAQGRFSPDPPPSLPPGGDPHASLSWRARLLRQRQGVTATPPQAPVGACAWLRSEAHGPAPWEQPLSPRSIPSVS
eukprot:TRINITY_DN1207_c0_g2_i1.p2 TRINITY_DN1207_c0_g2~~TRINITY_DN1207_c0_g2_i1.p2  ORF type:complete len:505 (+),score=144.10 TRINITY_DN1207_c0_g2_i1:56-1570(+)